MPARIAPGTRDEAAALLGPGRIVLLDGYNITLNQQPQLSLEEQRRWLVRLSASAAARLRVRPTVVFDGAQGGAIRSGERPTRGVTVVFSAPGVTADDEIDLAVAATDEPIVVVTDDNGLRDRVAQPRRGPAACGPVPLGRRVARTRRRAPSIQRRLLPCRSTSTRGGVARGGTR